MDIKIVKKDKRGDGLLDVLTKVDGEDILFVGVQQITDDNILSMINDIISKQREQEKKRQEEIDSLPPPPDMEAT